MAFGIHGIHAKMKKIIRKIESISWVFLLPLEVGPQNRGNEGHLKFSQNLPFVSLILFVESLIFIFLNQKCIVIMSKKV